MIRPGGDFVLPAITYDGDEVIYEDGLSEGNLHAMVFAAQGMRNDEIRARFGAQLAQVFIDRGYGLDQLPARDSAAPPAEHQRALVEHALVRGLVRDRFQRPMVP